MKVFFDLQDGFDNDDVIISSNDGELYKGRNITTQTQIGLAKSFELDLTSGKINLKVAVPKRHLSETKEIDVIEKLYVAISINGDNKLDWQLSNAPFMYL